MKNEFFSLSDLTLILVKEGNGTPHCAVIDTDKLEMANSFPGTWYALRKDNGIYVHGSTQNGTMLLHRVVINAEKGFDVDHINRNPLDNRFCNLQVVTHAENLQNQQETGRKNSTSGFRNVDWDKGKKLWRVTIRVNNKTMFIGRYKDLEDAVLAARNARQKYFTNSDKKKSVPQMETATDAINSLFNNHFNARGAV